MSITERVYRVYLTEAQHAVLLHALEFYAEEGILISGSGEEHRLVDGAMNALIVGQLERV